jgi:hypothetical protein
MYLPCFSTQLGVIKIDENDSYLDLMCNVAEYAKKLCTHPYASSSMRTSKFDMVSNL